MQQNANLLLGYEFGAQWGRGFAHVVQPVRGFMARRHAAAGHIPIPGCFFEGGILWLEGKIAASQLTAADICIRNSLIFSTLTDFKIF